MRGIIVMLGLVACTGTTSPPPSPRPEAPSAPEAAPPPSEPEAPQAPQGDEAGAPEVVDEAAADQPSAEPPRQQDVVGGVRGLLSRSKDGASLSPCGADQAWAITDPQGLLKGTSPSDGTPVYAELHLTTNAPRAVVAVLYADPAGETRGCDTAPRVGWTARGNEPFWTLAQVEGGTRWSTPDGEVSMGPLRREEESMVATGDGHTAVLRVRPLRCVDDMAGTVFGHTATVVFDGSTVQGCAAAPLDPGATLPRGGPKEPGPEHGG